MLIYQYDSNGYATGHTTKRQEGEPIPPGWTHKAPKGVEGERLVGNVWQAVPLPAPAVPKSVTRRQAKQQLAIAGLLDQVQPAIDAIEDNAERLMMQIYWDDSQVFERDHPQLVSLGRALGLGDDDINDMYRQAAIR